MKYRDAVASLVITDIVSKDLGLYTCEASNTQGYASSTAALKLKGKVCSLYYLSNSCEATEIPSSKTKKYDTKCTEQVILCITCRSPQAGS